ncbi:hypothetical protein PG987_006384 [Apiospora arundinis]
MSETNVSGRAGRSCDHGRNKQSVVSGAKGHSEQSAEGVAQGGEGQQLVGGCPSVQQVGRAQWFITADTARRDKGRV